MNTETVTKIPHPLKEENG